MKTFKLFFLLSLVCAISINLSAQNNAQKTKEEIKQALGHVPSFMEVVPDNMLPMAWEHFNSSSNPDNALPPKYVELIKLAVAAQIPCQYCIHAHETNAKAMGATDQEIKEAIMAAAWVRQWSTIVQTTTMSMEDFKKEYEKIMNYMAEQAKK